MSMLPPPPPGPPTSGSSERTTCYRHPDRDAGRRCTRCGKWACGECLVQAPVGSNCLECAKSSRPDVATRARFWSARQSLLVTMSLIVVNLAVYVWVILQDPSSAGRRGISDGQLRLGLNAQIVELTGEWYRVVTSGFLHFGLLHIAFNMYLLYLLGQLLEPSIGRVRFALLYFAALLGGSAGAMLLQPNGFHGGASGAVFGLMGAAFVGYSIRGVNPFSTGIGTILVLNLLITFTIPGISIGGHLGGVVAGALCAVVVLAPGHKGYPQWATYAVPAGVGLLSIVLTVFAISAA
jgi:membrane associated rhomboid family serine protease